MLGDVPARHKALLVRVELGNSPRHKAGVNQVGVYLTVSFHGGNGAVVSNQCGVTLLEEEAQVGIFKA